VSYRLDITPEAEAQLDRLVESLAPSKRHAALQTILQELATLAANPALAVRSRVGRPVYRFRFTVEEVTYYWAATFLYSTDEQALVITDVFRTSL
jgi:plasmid stabilization system protein ParE